MANKLLFSETEIKHRLHLLAERLNEDYKNKDLIVMGVLNGAIYFTADLTRLLNVEHTLTFVQLKSYGNEQVSSGKVEMTKSWNMNIVGKDILILEDILDSGLSMSCLLKHIESWEPKSVKIACMLWKRKSMIKPNYHCFEVEDDKWLIGNGLDDQGKKRNYKAIFELIN